jgi:hypothetical protein
MGWDFVWELQPPTGLLFTSRVICQHRETVVMTMPAGDNSWLVHQSSLEVPPTETSGASRRNGRRSENFAYQYLKYLKGSLTCRKILRHGTSGFTSHAKECVLRIFIASARFEPATFGSSFKHTNHYTTEVTNQTETRQNFVFCSWKYCFVTRTFLQYIVYCTIQISTRSMDKLKLCKVSCSAAE